VVEKAARAERAADDVSEREGEWATTSMFALHLYTVKAEFEEM
jgi:hypothetical protein